MPVEIRAATPADIPAILTLAAEAKALLKARNINQWQDDYPQQEVFEQDLRAGAGFAVCHAGQVAGYFAVLLSEDPNYHYIENGTWQRIGGISGGEDESCRCGTGAGTPPALS